MINVGNIALNSLEVGPDIRIDSPAMPWPARKFPPLAPPLLRGQYPPLEALFAISRDRRSLWIMFKTREQRMPQFRIEPIGIL